MTLSLFTEKNRLDVFKDDTDYIWLLNNLLPQATSWGLFHLICAEATWRMDQISYYQADVAIPRLQQLYGDDGLHYSYSGIWLDALPWSRCPALLPIKQHVEAETGETFNAVLINLYRDGSDYIGWHSDDEEEMKGSTIASVSLGAERDFLLNRMVHCRPVEDIRLHLAHNSMLVMAGRTQLHWRHSLPKREGCKEPRLNLTFRQLVRSTLPAKWQR